MAIDFQSTSISDANAAAAGVLAQSAIRDALLGHPSGAWTLVEEFDSSGTTIHYVVLKNDATLSTTDVEFFLVLARLASSGQVGFMVGEVYDDATNTLSAYVPQAGNTGGANTILADFSYAFSTGTTPQTWVLGTTFPSNLGDPLMVIPTSLATMHLVSIVEKDYAVISLNDKTIYVGALTDMIVPGPQLDAATPIGLVDLFEATVPAFGGLTRHPIDVDNAPMQVGYSHCLAPLLAYQISWAQWQAVATAIYLHQDRYQGDRVCASEMLAVMMASNTSGNANNGAEKVGALRGKFKNVRLTTYPWAASIYDLIVVDDRKHIILLDKGALTPGTFVTPNNYQTTIRWGWVFDTGQAA